MAIAANFAWPWTVYEDRLVYAGRVEQFPPGTVMSFAAIHGSSGRPAFHLVRLDDGEFLALLDRDPHLGDPVPYRPDFVFDGRTGWFRNPLHGKTFDMAGYRVFGPSPRGLDRLPDLVDGAIQQFERELVGAAAGTIGTLAELLMSSWERIRVAARTLGSHLAPQRPAGAAAAADYSLLSALRWPI